MKVDSEYIKGGAASQNKSKYFVINLLLHFRDLNTIVLGHPVPKIRLRYKPTMDGFAMALNPSLGLIGCCTERSGKSRKSCPDEDALKSGLTGSVSNTAFGVGIGYRHDKSGAFVVITLSLGGVWSFLKIIS